LKDRFFEIQKLLLLSAVKTIRLVVASVLLLLCMPGCQTSTHQFQPFGDEQTKPAPQQPEAVILREGDVIRVTFPSAPVHNTTSTIRRDGKITLSLVGEVTAAGKTPAELQEDLKKLYANELRSTEIIVSVESSSFSVSVTGAVLRQGSISSVRPLTVLEAVVQAGIDFTKANLKSVKVDRLVNGRSEQHTVNVKDMLDGKQAEPFYLKPGDIVFVPEKFVMF
jgi:protein involved in polysaccharide export with SLBB domain